MDRISHLPDFIVHHILSLFKTSSPSELVRLSVLSKTWFHLTASFPTLEFSLHNFRSRESFFKYVEYTTSRFCHHNLTAHRFKLLTNLREPAEYDVVDRCLGLLFRTGLEELVIYISNSSDLPNYRLPNILLSVSVLRSLTICGCELPSSLMLDAVMFKSLIHLELVNIHIDDEVIKYLTTSCPLLQVFRIRYCYGFKRFCVYGHQNLQQVCIYFDTLVERIDIEAPNLSYLSVADEDRLGPPQMNLASCKKLTSVFYLGHPLPNSNGVTDFFSNFPFLENLVFYTNYTGYHLKLSSHSLRTLELDSDFDLEGIELSTPNLGLFIYSCNDLYFDLGISHLPHLKACMRCYPEGSLDTLWFQKLRLFFDKKNGFKALNLYICTDQKFIVLEELKAIELPPYELQHIELHFEHEEPSDHAAFVDAVLWCFRPRSLTLRSTFPLSDFEESSDLVKFTYEKLLEQEDHGHTNIQTLSPSSSKAQTQFGGLMPLPRSLPRDETAISFIKEEGTFFNQIFL